MSLCSVRPSPLPPEPATPSSSPTIWLKRKSSTPSPPYSSGTCIASMPLAAALANSSRSTMPSASHRAWWGVTSSATKRRTDSRKSMCSGSNRQRRMVRTVA